MGTLSDIRDQRYWTEPHIGPALGYRTEESGVRHYIVIGINFYPISHIPHPRYHRSTQWLSSNALVREIKELQFKPSGCEKNVLMSDIRMDSTSISDLF